MYISGVLSALVASAAAVAVPQPDPAAWPGFTNPLEPRQTAPGALPQSPLNRLNPTYTKEQLNNIKLTYTEVAKHKYIQSLGKTDDYFKFDFTSAGFKSNAGNGIGGQGYLAQADNFPVLLNTGMSMAIGYLNPCEHGPFSRLTKQSTD